MVHQLTCAGDKIIVLAEDDDTYAPVEPGEHKVQMQCPDWRPKKRIERILFLGWRRDMHDIIGVLDKFVDPGSELWLYNEVMSFPMVPTRVFHCFPTSTNILNHDLLLRVIRSEDGS